MALRLARAIGAGMLLGIAVFGVAALLLPRADGPLWVLAGGPFRSGAQTDYAEMDWEALDALHELEMEIVGAESSRILWFSVHEGAPYVACDLDCIDGRLARWPRQIERDDRVVIRIEGKRVDARLVHVPHGTEEYAGARAARERKYAGDEGGRAAAETAAHRAVVGWGEALTGRAKREAPGDRMYRVDPRPRNGDSSPRRSSILRDGRPPPARPWPHHSRNARAGGKIETPGRLPC